MCGSILDDVYAPSPQHPEAAQEEASDQAGREMEASASPVPIDESIDTQNVAQAATDTELATMPTSCPHCGNDELYTRRLSSAGDEGGGGGGPYLLAGLGHFMHYAQFDVVVCARCGLTQFFAEPSAREKLESHKHWGALQTPSEGSDKNG